MLDADDRFAGYTLAWPPALFASEVREVLRLGENKLQRAELLLEEAFSSDEPRDDLPEAGNDPWSDPRRKFLELLALRADGLPSRSRPRAYYPDRAKRADPSDQGVHFGTLTPPAAQVRWKTLIEDFLHRGYLDRAAGGKDCVDDPHDVDRQLEEHLTRMLGRGQLWPLRPEWDRDIFYGLVEAVGDLLARPRSRSLHSWNECGWHYSNFAARPAQVLYRERVNTLLAQAGAGLQLADSGEDAGRLVQVTGDDRDQLLEQVTSSQTADVDPVRHAVAEFRRRDATVDTKRGAVLSLTRVLEARRRLIKTELLSKDEGALFTIANGFDIRHRDGRQQQDYEPVFLDWIFWWYLATIELTDRLIARPGQPGSF